MPLKNARHERMAQLLASGKTATEAHQLAGFKKDRGNASRLAKEIEIQGRVQQITAVGADRAAVTVESLIAECDEALALAREMRNPTAMVAAIKEKGILSGKRVERSERGTPGEFDFLYNCSAEQLQAYVDGRLSIEELKAASEKLN